MSGGGLLLGVLSWDGFSFSEFTVALGAVLGSCMVTLLVLEVDSGLATTHTLYLFVGMIFLFCQSPLFPFLLGGWYWAGQV